MTASQLCYGRRVLWRGLRAVIIEIRWQQRGDDHLVKIRVLGNHTHWTTAEALEALPGVGRWELGVGGSEAQS